MVFDNGDDRVTVMMGMVVMFWLLVVLMLVLLMVVVVVARVISTESLIIPCVFIYFFPFLSTPFFDHVQAHNDLKVRNKAVKRLRLWLSKRGDDNTETDLLKLWKAS